MENKEFIKGEDYRLKAFPKCICTFKGGELGTGTNREGVFNYSIFMGDPRDWEHLVKTVTVEEQESLARVLKNVGIRQFESGANRNSDEGKLDFEGFLSPTVLEAYAVYMNSNRKLENGDIRDSDNWQKGIPRDAYMKSMWRHFMDVWKDHRGLSTKEDEITNLCALLFNVSGLLHEKLK